MDLDGAWKPPQEWPESTPPLPGWRRNADGLWTNEEIQEIRTEDSAPTVDIDLTQTEAQPEQIEGSSIDEIEAVLQTEDVEHALGLSYATDAVATPSEVLAQDALVNRSALIAAITAAVVASMLGAGIVLLILL